MVIYLPGQSNSDSPALDELTPREIVQQLDKHVVGQADAKRAVAIALRNRVRRQKLDPEMAEEVMPKNILMIGPTGVGKTEIARRLARLSNSPFVKIEATKFTEIGYVGRDVDSMIRDLVEMAIEMVREEKLDLVTDRAEQHAEDRLLEILMPPQEPEEGATEDQTAKTREKLRKQLREGKLDDRIVEIEVRDRNTPIEIITNQGSEEMDINLRDMLPGLFGGQNRRRKMRVIEALDYLVQEEEQKLIDMDQVARQAVDRVEQSGIIFLDEMDKIAGREGGRGPDVSREGVQRDILPIVEGTSVNTRYGMVRTDHILFIGAGAFHVSKPSDMIPRTAGSFSDPRRAKVAHHRRLHSHPYRAKERANEAVHRTTSNRGRQAKDHRRRGGRDCAHGDASQRADREHWRASACTPSWKRSSTRFRSMRPI